MNHTIKIIVNGKILLAKTSIKQSNNKTKL